MKQTSDAVIGLCAKGKPALKRTARLADKLILLKKFLAQFGYLKQAANLTFGRRHVHTF
jgi:hypothetical protein